ncbi:FAD-dependent monooxygenase [Kineosporia sp. J2-2]|uniref:FAD-dependent monooxygenase n=1 Tax=Kineosporia corallincola TaxID=2835133 RepID=A0ABS5TIT0_9ACTN|nr:NAD(P)/FAD-dependent oxidoreductase [Kineosporia corallincola]MBT0770976.1 FAD-dependent monooxygenase [Kineosporia corallincola]
MSAAVQHETEQEQWDAVVVGARVAGAPTAMLLARAGHRVLLVDRAAFPSDTISTHLVHPTGVAALERWGLLDRLVATGCPPIDTYRIDFDVAVLSGRPSAAEGTGRTAYGPRRIVLDNLLVEAAREAGVTVRESWTVDEIVRSGERVIGVRGHHRGGEPTFESARVVIGADGKNSVVHKAVQAPEYDTRPALTAGYYAYWSGLPIDEFRVYVREHRAIVVVPTHDNQKLVLVGWPRREMAQNRSRVEETYMAAVNSVPELAGLMAGAHRETRIIGHGDTRNAMRVPFGPGWALVGDAGYIKDPATAQGISDAFRDAELLSAALDHSWSSGVPWQAAMSDYQRLRDGRAKPMLDFTCMLAPMDPLPAFVRFLFRSMQGNQPAIDRFLGGFAGTVPLSEVFHPLNTLGIVGSRVRRGLRQPRAAWRAAT